MLMHIRFSKLIILISCVLLIRCIVFVGHLWFDYRIGVPKFQIEADIRSGQKINPDWTVNGSVSDTIAAFISYPNDMTDHTFSVYVNRPGLSFGYFFRGGGDLTVGDTGIEEYMVEGYKERAFISVNKQQVECLKIDDGTSIKVIDIDSNKPFAIVLPVNAGDIAFYDVDGNIVEFQKHQL